MYGIEQFDPVFIAEYPRGSFKPHAVLLRFSAAFSSSHSNCKGTPPCIV